MRILNLQMFAATKPAQGFDVSVSVVGPNGPALVGEFEEISLDISNDTEEYMTLNSRMPMILDGEIKISGSLKRGFIDVGSALAATFGSSTLQPGLKFSSPRYIVSASFNAPEKGLIGRYNLTGTIIEKLGISATKGKTAVSSDYSFKSEGIQEAQS